MVQKLHGQDDPFSDEHFVERFVHRRSQKDSVNSCVDEPAILRRVAVAQPKRLLELGCATGMMTSSLAALSEHVTALDRSEVMVARARAQVLAGNVNFICTPFEDFQPSEAFDYAVSGMTMHLIEDFRSLAQSIYGWLKPGGHFLFTQRHPLRTANPTGETLNGDTAAWTVSDYFHFGKRRYNWLGQEVSYFHRTMSDIFATVIEAGFTIREVAEPTPEHVERTARIDENMSIPAILLVLCQKPAL